MTGSTGSAAGTGRADHGPEGDGGSGRPDRSLPPLRAGRRPAGLALLHWLEDEHAPRLCRISGSSGSGKTHLVRWLAQAGTAPGAPSTRVVHAVLPAQGLTVRSATWLLAVQLNLPARTPEELVAHLTADPRRTVLCVSDLDRAGGRALPSEPHRLVDRLLDPLLRLAPVRIVADAADGTPETAAFSAVEQPAVLDLDQPQWTERVRFARWYGGLAAHSSQYGHGESYPNPGLAMFTSRIPGEPQPEPAGKHRSLVEVWWDTAVPETVRPTLRALGLAAGPLTAEEWALLPGVGGTASVREAARLLPPEPEFRATEPRWWLSRPDLARAAENGSGGEGGVDTHTGVPAADELSAAVVGFVRSVPRRADGRPDYPAAGERRLSLLLAQAVLAGSAHQLLADPLFLAYADPVAVTSALDASPDIPSDAATAEAAAISSAAAVWAEAGPALLGSTGPAERAAVLGARMAERDPAAAQALATEAEAGATPWRVRWARWNAPGADGGAGTEPGAEPEPATIAGAVALTEFVDPSTSAPGVLAIGVDGRLRAIDALGGGETAEPAGLGRIVLPETDGPGGWADLTLAPWGSPGPEAGGGPVVALDTAGTVSSVSPAGEEAGGSQPLPVPTRLPVTALAALPDGLVVGDAEGTLFALGTGATARMHNGPVTSLAAASLAGAGAEAGANWIPLLISGGADGRVRLWAPGWEPAPPVDERLSPVTAVTVRQSESGGLLTAVAWADGLIRLRRTGGGAGSGNAEAVGGVSADRVADLRLGTPALALTWTSAGLVAALPDGMLGLDLRP